MNRTDWPLIKQSLALFWQNASPHMRRAMIGNFALSLSFVVSLICQFAGLSPAPGWILRGIALNHIVGGCVMALKAMENPIPNPSSRSKQLDE